eukprot:10723.XXX_33015_33200_1 [CDS] Oithona nana genome sequencing.
MLPGRVVDIGNILWISYFPAFRCPLDWEVSSTRAFWKVGKRGLCLFFSGKLQRSEDADLVF